MTIFFLDPKLLPAELEAVHRCICAARVPSWISWVKDTVGNPGRNSLKAAEWLILHSVYFALTLIPIWKVQSANPHCKVLLKSTKKSNWYTWFSSFHWQLASMLTFLIPPLHPENMNKTITEKWNVKLQLISLLKHLDGSLAGACYMSTAGS
ncbi:hypothetical protein VP01_269g10 [Puccinia sorghi]|uniref:Uncharacterized protein n=1 Tax=Puccinia sorghi TaxID=27349 RepID=A0A0L6V5I9_9BASI|nr:hypothetical protein VP01_269g10 [Puccinia sorghi]